MSSRKDDAASSRELARDAGQEQMDRQNIGRRSFMGAAIGVAAGAGVAAVLPANAQNAPPTVPGQGRPTPSPAAAPPAGSGSAHSPLPLPVPSPRRLRQRHRG